MVFGAKTLQNNTLSYPIEHVVRFLHSLKGSSQSSRPQEGVDIGLGSGQHLKLLMEFGYRATGVELVADAVQRVQTMFADQPLLGDLVVSDFRSAPFSENFFDVLICWGVLFLRPWEEMQRDMQHLYRMTREGGHVCMNFRTKDNWFFGRGQRISHDHYLLDETAGPYEGSHYTFLEEAAARELVEQAGFKIVNFERADWCKNNMQEKHSWWIVWAQRPAT